MNELAFLKKLKKKKIIRLIESSKEMKTSYLTKSENCLKSAKILFKNDLYENSVSEAYYCMYNSLLALLFEVGIKSENHSASIILFDKLFKNKEMAKIIFWAKEERIDKQYYVETHQIIKITKKSCEEIILKTENFLIQMKVLINNLNNQQIETVRKSFIELLK